MSNIDFPLHLFDCPECKAVGTLQATPQSIQCTQCQKEFPIFFKVPWLFRHPHIYQIQWQAKFQNYAEKTLNLIAQLTDKIQSTTSPLTRERLEKINQAEQSNLQTLTALLKPLLDVPHQTITLQKLVQQRVPSQQHVQSYFTNIFRDWVWGETENQKALQLIESLNPDLQGRELLVVGAGTGRLALDLHEKHKPHHTLALDINPVLIGVGQKILQGETLQLFELAPHPTSVQNVAQAHTLTSSNRPQNFHFVFTDGLNLPVKTKSIDVLLTPWFIDIVPDDFALLARRMNRVLKTDGQWLNFGPLGFAAHQLAQSYTFEEIKALLEQSGFRVEATQQEFIPYLQSPYDAQKRSETVYCFRAIKVKDVKEPPAHQHFPDWLLQGDKSIPQLPEILSLLQQSHTQATILGAVDGKRSLNEIKRLVAEHYQLPQDAALNLLIQIFMPLFEKR